ncbi:MAG: hypothetical protein M1381_02585 [Deltaproteobacteria bacterium]|nr:hypothetical protein [Deltaproteobacteria bacterium]
MITYPPKEVVETFGEHAAQGLEKWLGEVMKDTATNQAVAVLSKRIEHIEGSVDEIKMDMKDMRSEMNERFDKMNERFDRMNERFDKMNERFDTMYHQTFTLIKWTVGLLGFFGTVISTLIFVGQFIRH